MLELGRFNTLTVSSIDRSGAHMQAGSDEVILPRTELPEGIAEGDRLTVFVYRRGAGPLDATLRTPRAQVGEFAFLEVRETAPFGAFLDWGLAKDLLVPLAEQPEKMVAGRKYLVKIGLDNEGRVVGTARIDRCLESEEICLEEGEEVELQVRVLTDLGAKMIINDLYDGLLYTDELWPGATVGERRKGYVKKIRADHKIDVTLRRSGAEVTSEAREAILAALRKSGFLPLHDGSSPEEIRSRLGMSKKTFKKALGALYREKLIDLGSDGTRLKNY